MFENSGVIQNTSNGTKESNWSKNEWGEGTGGQLKQAGVAVGGMAVEMGAASLKENSGIDYDDLDDGVDQAGMVGAGALSGAAKGAAAGASFGPWGAAIGGAVGGVAGAIGGSAAGKKAEAERKVLVKKRNLGRMADGRTKIADKYKTLSMEANARFDETGKTMAARGGLKFSVVKYKHTFGSYEGDEVEESIPTFKKGGRMHVDNNMIPNGVSHEEKNSWGTKGMPVVRCQKEACNKIYEIESDEMILTKNTTKKIEELAYGGKLKELGEYFSDQVLQNTHSYTKTYNFLNT